MGPSAREVSSADQQDVPAILAWPSVSRLPGSILLFLVAILIMLISFHFNFSAISSFYLVFSSPTGRAFYI